MKDGLQGKWVMDSASTQHYTNDHTAFKTFNSMSDELIVANNQPIEIKGVGSIEFKTILSDGTNGSLLLKTVYYAPDLIGEFII